MIGFSLRVCVPAASSDGSNGVSPRVSTLHSESFALTLKFPSAFLAASGIHNDVLLLFVLNCQKVRSVHQPHLIGSCSNEVARPRTLSLAAASSECANCITADGVPIAAVSCDY